MEGLKSRIENAREEMMGREGWTGQNEFISQTETAGEDGMGRGRRVGEGGLKSQIENSLEEGTERSGWRRMGLEVRGRIEIACLKRRGGCDGNKGVGEGRED